MPPAARALNIHDRMSINEQLDRLAAFEPVPYPVVPYGQSLIRTSVMPTHTREHLDRALDAFAKVRKRYEIPEFDSENLPTSDAYDWSWFVADQSKTAAPAA